MRNLPGVCSDSCPLSQGCYLTISSSAVPFSFCLHSFPASGSFPMSQLFAPCGPSIGASASALVLPMNIQGWFPLGLTGWIFLLSKEFSRVFSSTTIRKHQFIPSPLSSGQGNFGEGSHPRLLFGALEMGGRWRGRMKYCSSAPPCFHQLT